jgi:hypothetical protein
MLSGNQIITTRFGGVTEHLTDKSARIIPHTLGPVKGMGWAGSLYSSKQRWAYPSTNHLSRIMRETYSNRLKPDPRTDEAYSIAMNMTTDEMAKFITRELKDRKL